MRSASTTAVPSLGSTVEPQRHGELLRCQCAQLYLKCIRSTQGNRFLLNISLCLAEFTGTIAKISIVSVAIICACAGLSFYFYKK